MQHFDAVIVGSGFGGSVMAYRLAEAGWSVCLLERGRVYPPGSFPRSPRQMANNFWDPSKASYGLYNIWSFGGLEALVSAGLGGGSLIYANVLLRKDEKWFVRGGDQGYAPWPMSRAELDPHYDRVERMLAPQVFPIDREPYASVPKTHALKHAAEQLGLDWQLPPLAVTFAGPGEDPVPGEPIVERPNMHGRTRLTCRLCGECNIGCNYGSKNTLDYNYLTEAQSLGVDIRTLCEVRDFAPVAGGGYTVRYVQHEPDVPREQTGGKYLEHIELSATHLVLSAGALGSTFLLMKNRDRLPALGDSLGTRFCDNGDLITFLLRARETVDGKKRGRELFPDHGPVITSAIRVPDSLDGGDGPGFYIEDSGYPSFASWMFQESDAPGEVLRFTRFAGERMWDRLTGNAETNLAGELAGLWGDSDLSSTTLPLLGMGRDNPNGKMRLEDGLLEIDWVLEDSRPYFERVRNTMHDIAATLEADFVDNPIWYLNRVITVHPLGGVPMGRDATEGVVDSFGEVFGHPGLHVADGSVMPGPVGANPSLTIAALADRFAERMVERGRT
ncbi:MAG: GMC family oxidoreductase [Candidatus Dormiibacterota bacterium]